MTYSVYSLRSNSNPISVYDTLMDSSGVRISVNIYSFSECWASLNNIEPQCHANIIPFLYGSITY
jgi:hypothetical protein